MRKFYLLLSVCFLNISHCTYAQCPVTAAASPISINCGDSVSLTAIPSGLKPLNQDFNGCTTGAWGATAGGLVVNNSNATYNCIGPSPDGPCYFFMGSTSNTPR